MILKQEEKTAIAIGNIQQNTVGIDTKNVNFITSLLTEKLYSKPIQSFLREIVSNAYDSHIEANSSEPILISLSYDNSNYIVLSVRDYGTGLSPERFNLIYKNIGSSSKRESDDYIGCLGIGRFSCLAVSNRCTIVSYYEGTKDTYLMYKDEGTVHIDKMSSVATKEHNGIEVSVMMENSYSTKKDLSEGIENLAYFPNIYVHNPGIIQLRDEFNKRKILKATNFSSIIYPTLSNTTSFEFEDISSYYDYSILYGNVIYPLKITGATNISPQTYLPKSKNFCLKFDIGELDITPSRESLQMTKKTISAITQKLLNYDAELKDLLRKELFPINSFGKVFDYFRNDENYYNTFSIKLNIDSNSDTVAKIPADMFGSLISSIKDNIVITEGNKKVSINGNSFVSVLNIFSDYREDIPLENKVKTKYRKLLYKQEHMQLRELIRAVANNEVFVSNSDKILNIVSQYIKEKGLRHYYLINKKWEKGAFNNTFIAAKRLQLEKCKFKKDEIDTILKNILRWYYSKRILLSKKTLPKSFIDKWNDEHKRAPREKRELVKEDIAFWGFNDYKQSFTRIDKKFIMHLKKTNKIYVFDKDSASIPLILRMFRGFKNFIWSNEMMCFGNMNMYLCAVSKKNLPYCQSMGLLTETDFMSCTNPIFMKLAAIMLWKNNLKISSDYNLCSTIGQTWKAKNLISDCRLSDIQNCFGDIKDYLTNSGNDLDEIINNCIENNLVNWSFYAKLPTIDELKILNIATTSIITNRSDDINRDLLMLILMKKKIIPFNVRLYHKSKIKVNECIEGR